MYIHTYMYIDQSKGEMMNSYILERELYDLPFTKVGQEYTCTSTHNNHYTDVKHQIHKHTTCM